MTQLSSYSATITTDK